MYEFIHMNSDIWIHDILHDHEFIFEFISWIHMQHFMTYEFIYEFMYMKNIVKSYLNSCVPRFQMTTLGLHYKCTQMWEDIFLPGTHKCEKCLFTFSKRPVWGMRDGNHSQLASIWASSTDKNRIQTRQRPRRLLSRRPDRLSVIEWA